MKEQIIKVMQDVLHIENPQIDGDKDLSELGLTSISLINIIVGLEDCLDFEFDEEDLLLDNLNTINKIEKCVEKTLSSK